ncbi:unnamed protein product [Staurois parvus]|uniref:ATP synthase subunit s, mitochondrial n=1 Tax=Staurois parvus TaxID=386267 RepID=A0ABN9GNC8_9NEOB|nr:unnamed protein product [Staurois parvus]
MPLMKYVGLSALQKRGHLGDICTVLTFLDLKKLDWLSVLQD